ncbi:hypothetical protein [Sphingobacterium sp. LRF_L2]|uniref:hypothetical protein n=1 Tax=Sphingobacterium sp. LRF_L2 TaxID=3369421 RepID=UPI003F63BC3E
MRTLIMLTLMLTSTTALQSCAQESESYWRIKSIHREDGEPFLGLTAMSMEEIADYNFHFVKRNDSLYFEWPEKFAIGLNDFKELSQLQITDKDYYDMYDHRFQGNSFLIKFVDKATNSKSKNTIMEFEKIDHEAYKKDLAEAIAYQKTISDKIEDFKKTLAKDSPIVLEQLEKLPTKVDTIFDDTYDSDIILRIPEKIALWESGDLKNEKFGPIKIGTFKEHSKIYDIEHADDYGLKQLTLWLSTDPTPFDMESFIAENTQLVVVKEEKDAIVGYTISYNVEEDKPFIQSFITLKYYLVGKTHVFIYGDVSASQMQNASDIAEMNKILNFNHLILNHITIEPNS